MASEGKEEFQGCHGEKGVEGEENVAPMRLMALFLKAVTEGRMSEALGLATTVLQYEPHNPMLLDYKKTLSQYIANERELAGANGEGNDKGQEEEEEGKEGDDDNDSSSSSTSSSSSDSEEDAVSVDNSGDGYQEEQDKEQSPLHARTHTKHESTSVCRPPAAAEEKEEAYLADRLHDLRMQVRKREEGHAAAWDTHKFAPSNGELEATIAAATPSSAGGTEAAPK